LRTGANKGGRDVANVVLGLFQQTSELSARCSYRTFACEWFWR